MEICQIAGRAGRYTQSGYFVHLELSLQLRLSGNVESHKFESIKKSLENHLLSFKSEFDSNSLKSVTKIMIILKKDAEDQKFLNFLKIINQSLVLTNLKYLDS